MVRVFLIVESAIAGLAVTMTGVVASTNGGTVGEDTLIPAGVMFGGLAITAAAAWKAATFCSRMRSDLQAICTRLDRIEKEQQRLKRYHEQPPT